MRRWIACLAVVLLCMQPAMADEGMWLMHRLAEIYPQMKARGLKIKDKRNRRRWPMPWWLSTAAWERAA